MNVLANKVYQSLMEDLSTARFVESERLSQDWARLLEPA